MNKILRRRLLSMSEVLKGLEREDYLISRAVKKKQQEYKNEDF